MLGFRPMLILRDTRYEGLRRIIKENRMEKVNTADGKKRTALMIAAKEGDFDVVEYLLSIPECDANLQDNKGNTALMLALKKNRCYVANIIVSERGCNLSQRNLEGRSAWYYAIRSMDCDIVEKLVELGRHQVNWSINERTHDYGYTALHIAVYFFSEDNLPLIELLLRLGADPLVKNNWGYNSMRCAVGFHSFESLQLFMDHPKAFNAKGWGGFKAISIAFRILPTAVRKVVWSLAVHGEVEMNNVENKIYKAAFRRNKCGLVTDLLQNNCKFPATLYFKGVCVPIFEFTVSRGFFSIARLLFEAGAKLGIKFCPEESKYFSYTFGRYTENLHFKRVIKESDDWVKKALSNSTPRRLLLLCRSTIRNSINVRLRSAVQSLEIPEEMKAYVLMKEEFNL